MSETALATLADYAKQADRFNILHPTVLAQEADTSPMLKQTATTVQIAAGSLDTYSDYLFANNEKGEYALTGYGLQRIAVAAGIQFHPQLSGPVPDGCTDFPDGHRRYTYRAVGGVRQPNGEVLWLTKSKEIDTRSLLDAYEMQVRGKAKRERKSVDEEELKWNLKKRLIQIKEHLASNAETKAQLRVVRALLGLKAGSYSKAELAKPFVVPRLVVRPEFIDPKDVIASGRVAAGELYGPGAQGKGAPASARELPTGSPAESPASSTANGEASSPAGGNGSGASATGRTESRSGASAGREPADADAASTKSETDAPEPTPSPDGVPKSDPIIPEGKYAGERMSVVAETDPEYMRGVADTHSRKGMRELAQAWIDYWHGQKNPRLV